MADEDEYAKVSRGKLKLKANVDLKTKKKKKKKNKDKDKEKAEKTIQNVEEKEKPSEIPVKKFQGRPLTQAEKKFKEQQEKMQTKRINDKASMTHKQKVEKFNQHLDSLTEHFDIPKVSWTK